MRTNGILGLNPSQRGMVFRQLVGPAGGVDIVQVVVSLPQPPDAQRLEGAWRAVIAHYPVLHSHAVEADEGEHVLQAVAFQPDLAEFDIADERAFATWLQLDRARGFDIFRQVPLRLALLRTPGSAERLVWSFHRVLLDNRSVARVLVDVFDEYDAPSSLTSPPTSPGAHIDSRASESLEAADPASPSYWRELLSDFEQPVPFPIVDPGAESAANRMVDHAMTPAQSAAIEDWIARQSDVDFDSLVQAAWAGVLARHVDQDVVVFGRQAFVNDASAPSPGMSTVVVPMRAQVGVSAGLDVARALHRQGEESRACLGVPMAQMLEPGRSAAENPMFHTVLACEDADLDARVHRLRPAWRERHVALHEWPPYPLVIQAFRQPGVHFRLAWQDGLMDEVRAARVLDHLVAMVLGIVTEPSCELRQLPMLGRDELELIRGTNLASELAIESITLHDAFARAVTARPLQPALTGAGRTLSFAELDAASDAVAAALVKRGVRRGTLVGLSIDRSLELVIAMIGILKAGAAYLPLDPAYPGERIDFCMRDSRAQYVITQRRYAHRFPPGVDVILVEEAREHSPATWWHEVGSDDDLAYVIYTSGSTGKPKGVKVSHGNVTNFFAGMDALLVPDEDPAPRRWLAVTSPSFDISVLELLWTLTRGFEVVVHGARDLTAGRRARWPSFSLFHFANGMDASDPQPYRLILEGAKFADSHGFEAVWSPERHFHDFGAPYPNPGLINAALATITRRVQLRAGSVVSPLHHPLRLTEDWALVDQLSGGRVGISFASGWQPNDFVLAPDNYERRKDLMFEQIETVRALWRGERIAAANPKGDTVQLGTYPRPVQAELPVWITAAGSPDTFRQAGAIGANILTHMLGQSLADLASNIRLYRQARAEAGLDPETGRVTVMVHTFVGETTDAVREQVREPMRRYLRSAANLVGGYADAWAAFKRGAGQAVAATAVSQLSAEEQEELYDFAFERYFESSGLFGSVDKCVGLVESLRDLEVDEIACLIDFGVATDTVLEHLPWLHRLQTYVAHDADADSDLVRDIAAHAITHLQCTPSLASTIPVLVTAPDALASLRHVLIGGEALPPDLVAALYARLPDEARIINVYGPTETTIWSTAQPLERGAERIAIGLPLANTCCHVLDTHRQPVPPGCIGELHIGGRGVAQGYHERPELNAARFLSVDIDGQARRLYATGDLVRQLDDGRLEYVGRNDFQVKVRGHRIELGEIEVALRSQPGVTDAVVVARSLSAGAAPVLVGYLVGRRTGAGEIETLKTALRRRLPDYMVPNTFVWLDALPLTPNGKVDRNALPSPIPAEVPVRRDTNGTGMPTPAAAEEAERVIREVWQRVLNIAEIGRRDNFFELGGHSILAVKVQSELSKAFGFRLPIVELFRSPTIEALAGHFTRHTAPVAGATAAGVDRGRRRRAAMNLRAAPVPGRSHEGT